MGANKKVLWQNLAVKFQVSRTADFNIPGKKKMGAITIGFTINDVGGFYNGKTFRIGYNKVPVGWSVI
jgi:hypothetical protein